MSTNDETENPQPALSPEEIIDQLRALSMRMGEMVPMTAEQRRALRGRLRTPRSGRERIDQRPRYARQRLARRRSTDRGGSLAAERGDPLVGGRAGTALDAERRLRREPPPPISASTSSPRGVHDRYAVGARSRQCHPPAARGGDQADEASQPSQEGVAGTDRERAVAAGEFAQPEESERPLSRGAAEHAEKNDLSEHSEPFCEQLRNTICGNLRNLRMNARCDQNIVFGFADSSGTRCSTSQCSTTLPSSSRRKMSMPAQSVSPGQVWWQCRTT